MANEKSHGYAFTWWKDGQRHWQQGWMTPSEARSKADDLAFSNKVDIQVYRMNGGVYWSRTWKKAR